MDTLWGKEALDGDYCLVLDNDYLHRDAKILPAKVYNGKAYTGYRKSGTDNYIHKITAIIKIPKSFVDKKTIDLIEKDILESSTKKRKSRQSKTVKE